jgi:cephalosporin hydroxylase|tara:strand:+ start:281 stop:1039 length:759 start_codon:yes stop_codon:yes gene_type:complete
MKKLTQDPVTSFFEERNNDISQMAQDEKLKKLSLEWMLHADKYKYTYNFSWMGRPIIKFPSDMIVQQEIMWKLKPDLIIETGIAHGGSILFSASMIEMMGVDGEVVAIDIDIREHNKKLIEAHPMYKRITMYEGSSVDTNIINKVKEHAKNKKCVMLILDSNHTHDHVLEELRVYAPLVTIGSYCILPDTFIEFFPPGYSSNHNKRPWDVGNNPYTAMKAFLEKNKNFSIDKYFSDKAMITETIDGYLKRDF